MFGKTDKPEGTPGRPLDAMKAGLGDKPEPREEPSVSASAEAPSLISSDMKVVGNLHSGGDIQIDGTVEGDVNSRTLTVGEGAHITGSINAESVRICGTISGQVQAAQVRIARTAHVKGDITYQKLAIEEDAEIDGQIRRVDPSKGAAQPGAAKAAEPAKPAEPAKAGEPAKQPAAAGAPGAGSSGAASAPKVAPLKPGEQKPAAGGSASSPGAGRSTGG